MSEVKILVGDCRERLADLPDGSVDCIVTSPPYFGLRDYGCDGQIGLESTVDAYVAELVAVFRECRRVLKREGTLWLNLGDSYASRPNGSVGKESALEGGQASHEEFRRTHALRKSTLPAGLKHKDLIGIPWRVAFALQADGWWLRQDIIWAKPNPMPESVRDRCTKAHEYLFMLSKSERYFYDAGAIAEPAVSDHPSGNGFKRDARLTYRDDDGARGNEEQWTGVGGTRNRRSVWTIATRPYAEAHFATMPAQLAEDCIKAGCPAQCCARCGAPWVRPSERVDEGYDGSRYGERAVSATGGVISGGTAKSTLGSSNGKLTGKRKAGDPAPSCGCDADAVPGTVLDPFGGAGTTGLAASRHGRDAVLIELSASYAEMAAARIRRDAPLFARVEIQTAKEAAA